jgi:hypothetical protein
MMLQEYDFDIEHVAGEENVIADAFSRLVNAEGLDSDAVLMLGRAKVHGLSRAAKGFAISDEHYALLKQFHNDIVGHHGVDETIRMLTEKGYDASNFPKMRTNVVSFIHKCACCQKLAQRKPRNTSHPFVLGSYAPMHKVSIDTMGPFEKDELGNKYIVAMTDCFSRFTLLFPVRDATATSAARAILYWVGIFGKPDYLLSDMGTQYINKHVDALLKALKTHKLDILAGVSQKNGIQERRNKEVNRHLRAIFYHNDVKGSWSDAIPLVQRIMNAQYVESLGTTPASIIFGDVVKLDNGLTLQIDADTASSEEKKVIKMSDWTTNMLEKQREIIRVAQLVQAQKHDDYFGSFPTEEITTFPISSYVLVDYGKQGPPDRRTWNWRGPYRVVKRDEEDPDRYTVQNLVTMKLEDFPTAQLKQFIADDREDPMVAANADHHNLIVEEVLSHQGSLENLRDLVFQVKIMGKDEPDVLSYHDLKVNDGLFAYCEKLGGEWEKLIPEQYTHEGDHYKEKKGKRPKKTKQKQRPRDEAANGVRRSSRLSSK